MKKVILTKTENQIIEMILESDEKLFVSEYGYNVNPTKHSYSYGLRELNAAKKLVQKGLLTMSDKRSFKHKQWHITNQWFYPTELFYKTINKS